MVSRICCDSLRRSFDQGGSPGEWLICSIVEAARAWSVAAENAADCSSGGAYSTSRRVVRSRLLRLRPEDWCLTETMLGANRRGADRPGGRSRRYTRGSLPFGAVFRRGQAPDVD